MFSSTLELVYQFSNIFGTTHGLNMRVIYANQKGDPAITLVKSEVYNRTRVEGSGGKNVVC